MLWFRFAWCRDFRSVLIVLRELIRDGLQFMNVAARFPNRRSGGSSVLKKAACLQPGSPDQASQADRCWASVAGAVVSAFRLERSAHRRSAGNIRPLASQEFQVVPALEVAGGRPLDVIEEFRKTRFGNGFVFNLS